MDSSERRRAVQDLVDAALKVDVDSRGNFIRDRSGTDLSLRDEALTLLDEIHNTPTAIGSSPPASGNRTADELPETTDISGKPQAGGSSLQFMGTPRFEVRRMLGSGAFGTVYECHDRDLRHSVAVKVLRQTDPAFLYRFKREFRALVDIRHVNLVQLYELFGEGQTWFFSMEFVRGLNFLRYVEGERTKDASRRHRCDLDRLRETLRQLSEGILVLHGRGMLHRDIKPANVLVSPDGRVHLLDFGLVHELELSGPHSAILAGTPAYMAPERLALQPAGTASDWYSVGVMLFEALTGALPFTDTRFRYDSASSMLSQVVDAPTDLKQLCTDLLHPDPTKRPNGTEIRRRLDAPVRPRSSAAGAGGAEELVVGRETELARLAALLELTRQGQTVVVNLSGQSGIGKSTVLRTFRRQIARTDPAVVMLIGRCHENESVPFKTLDDLVDRLSQYLKTLSAAEAEVLTPRDTGSLIRMFPVLAQVEAIARGRQINVVDVEELRHRAFDSLQDLIGRLAERKTLVLAIDDLQWGDLDSAAFLRALFGGTNPPSVLMIAAYRAEDAAISPFLGSWRKDLSAARAITLEDIALGELTPADSQRLAAGLLQSYAGIREGVAAETIVRESGGSPFLIEHFVRSVRWDRADQTGFNVRQALEDRLSELPERTRRLLETLAIAGQPLTETVAYAAADWDAADRPALLTLVTEHFVRIRGIHASRQLEIYHDRLRENIVAAMSRPARQDRHLHLATALEGDANADPAAISTHWREAGDPHRASTYAAAAGDEASNALAFERAAQWYQAALEIGSWTPAETTTLQRKLAKALASAGRGVPAAEVYSKAAQAAEPRDRAELQRLAAEQLLRAGRFDEGLAVLEALAREFGIWLAPKRWQQLVSLLLHRARAALPVLTVRRPTPERADRQLIILDVYWAFLIGFVNFDAIRAQDFQARHLALAMRVGDPSRLGIALAFQAGNVAAFTGRNSDQVQAILARARGLCDGKSAEAMGLISTATALCATMAGEWRRALQLAAEAERFLAENCSGVVWERATSIALRIDAAFHCGEWSTVADYGRRHAGRIEEARARGDVHVIVAALLEGAIRFIIDDKPELAEQFARDTLGVLPKDRFLTPMVWAFGIKVFTALYVGDSERAWATAEREWPNITKSQYLRVQYAAIAALDVRARAAIAIATLRNADERHLREALRCARQLTRKAPRWGPALALLLQAGVANVRRDRQTTLDLLERAEQAFNECDMIQYVAVCRYRRGLLIGGDEGRALVAAADAWAAGQRVVNPERVFEMLAPGRWG